MHMITVAKLATEFNFNVRLTGSPVLFVQWAHRRLDGVTACSWGGGGDSRNLL